MQLVRCEKDRKINNDDDDDDDEDVMKIKIPL